MTDKTKSGWSRRLALGGAGAAALGLSYLAFRNPAGNGFHTSDGDPRILRRGNSAEPATLDPHKADTIWEDWIIGDMMVGLMHQDAAGNPIPAACESYKISADGLTYTIQLRDHTWSDGTPVTAEDYLFSLRRIADPKTAAQYVSILYPIRNMQAASEGKVRPDEIGVRAIDSRTLEIQVHFQTPYMNQLLMHQTMYAVPKHVVEKHGDAWLAPQNIVTNGPFLLKEWVPNDHVLLIRNPRFFDATNVHFDKIYFYPTEDASAALRRFRAGDLDLANRCPPASQVPLLKKVVPKELKITPCVASYFLAINTERKPFDDVRVRTALALAIDRETIVDKVIRIGQPPAYGIVPPGMPNYSYSAQARFKSQPMAQRLEKAKSLLAEAGFSPSNPLAFEYYTQNSSSRADSVALQAMWRSAGIDVKIVPIDVQILYQMLRKRDFAVALSGWIADFRDPKNFLFLFQSTSTDLNYGGYHNEKYDALVANSDNIIDQTERLNTLAQAEQILLDDMGAIPLYFDVTRDIVSPQVQGWVSNPSNFNRSRWLSLDRSAVDA